tara:strand:- start:145 stop:303 length:159 start_codon:yes stop_codon:yes gene_type:complete
MNEKEILLKCIKYPHYPAKMLINKYGLTISELQKVKNGDLYSILKEENAKTE